MPFGCHKGSLMCGGMALMLAYFVNMFSSEGDANDPYYLSNLERSRSKSTKEDWEDFSYHRSRLLSIFKEMAGTSHDRSMVVLGSGNINDIELSEIAPVFGETVLCDLHQDIMADGVRAQYDRKGEDVELDTVDKEYRIKVENMVLRLAPSMDGGAGVMELLEEWSRQSRVPDATDIARSLYTMDDWKSPNVHPITHSGQFDVSVSTNLWSQIMGHLSHAMGSDEHPSFHDVLYAMRNRHMKALLDLLRPGGWGCLVTDVVSETTLPELSPGGALDERVSDEVLKIRMKRELSEGNFFHGSNPGAIVRALLHAPMLAPHVIPSSIHVDGPWRWAWGDRCFVVFAIRFQKKA